ncbi:MAG: hypothetical protein R3B52_00265 [Candidatus Paceibacterota bacterium]
MKRTISLIAVAFLLIAHQASAASIFAKAKNLKTSQGDRTELSFFIDTQSEEINAAELKIGLVNIEVESISYGESIIPTWIQAPLVKEGTVSLAGIIPGGYNSQSYAQQSLMQMNGYLFTVVGKSKGDVVATVLEGSQVAKSDGEGTLVSLQEKISINAGSGDYFEKPKDTTPPRELQFEIVENTQQQGESLLFLYAEDRQSGIAGFQIKKWPWSGWKKAQNPYIMKGSEPPYQARVFDVAGNSAVFTLSKHGFIYVWLAVALAVLAVTTLAYRVLFRHKKDIR